MRVSELAEFIIRREAHRQGRRVDPIIGEYRFCNVRREDDRVTKWIADNWREPRLTDPFLWFAMAVARLLNLPDSLSAIGYPVPWEPERVKTALHQRKDLGFKNFNAAYIVSTNGVKMDKIDYICDFVLSPLWRKRVDIAKALDGATLAKAHAALEAQPGLGSFLAAQLVADLKYTPALVAANDWATFAASGPGSRRGMNRVMQRDLKAPGREADWRAAMDKLRPALLKKLPRSLKNLHAQDIQNCLCEFDKYERARLGEGRPKQKYVPHEEK
jgi:hypothetical protein